MADREDTNDASANRGADGAVQTQWGQRLLQTALVMQIHHGSTQIFLPHLCSFRELRPKNLDSCFKFSYNLTPFPSSASIPNLLSLHFAPY